MAIQSLWSRLRDPAEAVQVCTVVGVDFESQDNIDINLQRQFECLDNAFEISDGIFIQEGTTRTGSGVSRLEPGAAESSPLAEPG